MTVYDGCACPSVDTCCSYALGVGTKDGMFDPAELAALRAHPEPRIATHAFLSFFEGAPTAFRATNRPTRLVFLAKAVRQ